MLSGVLRFPALFSLLVPWTSDARVAHCLSLEEYLKHTWNFECEAVQFGSGKGWFGATLDAIGEKAQGPWKEPDFLAHPKPNPGDH